MKIALIVHDLHSSGGHSLYTKTLAYGLSRNHEVTVFANMSDTHSNNSWEFRRVSALRVNALSSVQTFPLGMRRHAEALAGFDITHAQGYCGGNPNVVTAHICVASYLNSLRSISLRNRLSLKSMAAVESKFYRQYDGQVIAISKKIAGDLREHYRVRCPIKVIPHGVDNRRFSSANRVRFRSLVRRELGIAEDQTLALYVGDLTKAHTHLKSLGEAAPDIQMVIVTRSRRYRWHGENVRILPPTSEIERYYAAADALVFPSTYDAFGLVILEAMASGLAVFTSDCAGASEIISSGRDGFVFPLDEWVEGTVAALRDRELICSIGQKAEASAQEYGWPSVVQAVERTYLEVIASSN